MGNSYSVAREEQEEAEYLNLVQAVEIAQQRSMQQNDVESGLYSRNMPTFETRLPPSGEYSRQQFAPPQAFPPGFIPVPVPVQGAIWSNSQPTFEPPPMTCALPADGQRTPLRVDTPESDPLRTRRRGSYGNGPARYPSPDAFGQYVPGPATDYCVSPSCYAMPAACTIPAPIAASVPALSHSSGLGPLVQAEPGPSSPSQDVLPTSEDSSGHGRRLGSLSPPSWKDYSSCGRDSLHRLSVESRSAHSPVIALDYEGVATRGRQLSRSRRHSPSEHSPISYFDHLPQVDQLPLRPRSLTPTRDPSMGMGRCRTTRSRSSPGLMQDFERVSPSRSHPSRTVARSSSSAKGNSVSPSLGSAQRIRCLRRPVFLSSSSPDSLYLRSRSRSGSNSGRARSHSVHSIIRPPNIGPPQSSQPYVEQAPMVPIHVPQRSSSSASVGSCTVPQTMARVPLARGTRTRSRSRPPGRRSISRSSSDYCLIVIPPPRREPESHAYPEISNPPPVYPVGLAACPPSAAVSPQLARERSTSPPRSTRSAISAAESSQLDFICAERSPSPSRSPRPAVHERHRRSPLQPTMDDRLASLLRTQERLLTLFEQQAQSWRPDHGQTDFARARGRSQSRGSYSSAVDRYDRMLSAHQHALEEHAKRAQLWHEQAMWQLAKVVDGLEKNLLSLRRNAMSSIDSLPLNQPREEAQKDSPGGASGDTNEKTLVGMADSPGQARPYPHLPYAAGFHAVRRCSDDWRPAWSVFPLKAFRGSSFTYLKIQSDWDDAALLREMSRSYDKLRTVWRKWFSLRSVRSITMVYADHTFVYPKRVGPAGVSPTKNMRLRWFLHHPEKMKGRYEFMQVLTARTDLGIEFVEGWQLTRISIAILLPVVGSLLLGIFYSLFVGEVSDAFTIAGYMTSAYSVCLVLLGLLNFVEF